MTEGGVHCAPTQSRREHLQSGQHKTGTRCTRSSRCMAEHQTKRTRRSTVSKHRRGRCAGVSELVSGRRRLRWRDRSGAGVRMLVCCAMWGAGCVDGRHGPCTAAAMLCAGVASCRLATGQVVKHAEHVVKHAQRERDGHGGSRNSEACGPPAAVRLRWPCCTSCSRMGHSYIPIQ